MAEWTRVKDFLDEVEEYTFHRRLCHSGSFVSNLLLCKRGSLEKKTELLLGQVKVAWLAKANMWLKTVA